MLQKIKSHLTQYDISYIVLLALVVRVIAMQWMGSADFPEFYRDYHMARGIAQGTHYPLFGPPSMLGGFHFGPVYYYMLAPFYVLFFGHPVGLIAAGVVVSTFTVWVLYKVVLLWSGDRVFARLASLYTALSVYALHLTSYTSNPNFLPVFVLWYFYCLTRVLQSNARTRDYVGLGLSFAIATQLHATALLLLPAVTLGAFVILRWMRKRLSINKKVMSIAVGVAAVVYAPYMIYDAVHGFSNIAHLFHLGTNTLRGGHTSDGFTSIWNLFHGTITPYNFAYSYTVIEPNILYLLVAGLMAIVLAVVLYRWWQRGKILLPQKPLFSVAGTIIAWLWFVLHALVIVLYSRGAHDHYVIIFWPLPMIALAYATVWLKERMGTYVPLVVAIVVTCVLQLNTFYRHAGGNWDTFLPRYHASYEHRPDVSEIGSKW